MDLVVLDEITTKMNIIMLIYLVIRYMDLGLSTENIKKNFRVGLDTLVAWDQDTGLKSSRVFGKMGHVPFLRLILFFGSDYKKARKKYLGLN